MLREEEHLSAAGSALTRASPSLCLLPCLSLAALLLYLLLC
jgi:hypothetical protein